MKFGGICILIFAGVCAEGGLMLAQEQAPPAPAYRVLESWKAKVGDHTITYNRVAPPVPPAPTPRPAPVMSPEFLQRMQARAQKNNVFISLGATVFDGQFAVLRWRENDREHRAVSNIDFKTFCGIGEIETSDTIYSYFLSVGDQSSERLAEGDPDSILLAKARLQLTNLSLSPNSRSAYLMAEGSAADTMMTAAVDAMHSYYDANREKMIQEYQQRMAAYAAQQQWAKDHPPVPKDTVVNFWPKKSATNRVP